MKRSPSVFLTKTWWWQSSEDLCQNAWLKSWALAFLLLLFALAAAGCSASIEERDPALPEGFEGAFLPDVDIRGYLYLSQREPLLATSDKLVDGFVPGPDFPKKVKLSKMVIWASASPRVYGMLYEFSDTHVARSLAEELESSTMEFRHRRQG